MSVNTIGKIAGGGTPVGKTQKTLPIETREVHTRKATKEELAELDRKLGKPKDRTNGRREFLKRAVEEARMKNGLSSEDRKRLENACEHITEEKWRKMHAFVVVAGALHGWRE